MMFVYFTASCLPILPTSNDAIWYNYMLTRDFYRYKLLEHSENPDCGGASYAGVAEISKRLEILQCLDKHYFYNTLF